MKCSQGYRHTCYSSGWQELPWFLYEMTEKKKMLLSPYHYVYLFAAGQVLFTTSYVLSIFYLRSVLDAKTHWIENELLTSILNWQLVLFTSIIIIGIIRQPLAWAGLLHSNLSFICASSFLEWITDLLCIIVTIDCNGEARFIAVTHILGTFFTVCLTGRLWKEILHESRKVWGKESTWSK